MSKIERDKRGYYCIWFCDNCGFVPGGSGGMSTAITEHCPECQHRRCKSCIVEPVYKRKFQGNWTQRYQKEQGKSRTPRNFQSRSPPTPPPPPPLRQRPTPEVLTGATPKLHTISLPLLQKVPAEHLDLTISEEEVVRKSVNSSHTYMPGSIPSQLEHPSSMIGPLESSCIALADISPPSSPPGLSPSPTDTSLSPSDSINFDASSPSMTDLSSDIISSAGEGHYHEEFTESESDSQTALLDCRLFAVLGHDLELAACLIPRIHALLQWGFVSGETVVRVIPSQGPGETGQASQSSVSSSPPGASSTAKYTELQGRKRKRDSGKDGDGRRNRGSKGSEDRMNHESPRRPRFACPFYKKDPQKFVVGTDIKYRTCVGPGTLESRRITDHFIASHRPPQCDRCYGIFEDVTQLTNHRRSEPPCTQNGVELKEGIDDGQWDKIKELVKTKERGRSASEKVRHDIDKWFDLWAILFPETPRPPHPWSDSGQTKQPAVTLHVASLIDTLDMVIELDIQRGNLQRDDSVHERYRLAVRQVLETAIAASSQTPANSSLSPVDFNRDLSCIQELSQGGGIISNQLLAPSDPFGQSPTEHVRGYSIHDSVSQPWTPRSQMGNSTPSVSTQSSLATQWGTPQELSTPATSSSLNTAAALREPSTANSHVLSESPAHELNETLGLPLQIEWNEDWGQLQGFGSGAAISQGGIAELAVPLSDSEQRMPSEYNLPEDDTVDIFANNDSLTAILESEIELPTAGTPFKDHRDRNRGLQRPFYED